MARTSSVRYYRTRKAYYTQINGIQHHLATGPNDKPDGPTYLAAVDKFAEVSRMALAPDAGDGNTLRTVGEKYLSHIVGKRQPRTYAIRKEALESFCNAKTDSCSMNGERRVRDLKHCHVYAFCSGDMPNNSARMLIHSLQAALNWAVKSGLIPKNPLVGIETPTAKSRGKDCVIEPEAHIRLLHRSSVTLRPILVLLENSGARPGEICAAQAKDFNPDLGAIIYHADDRRREDEFRHKTAGKGRDRMIFLSGDALDLVKRLVVQRPTGGLFRTAGRKLWTSHTVATEFHRLIKRLKLRGITPYGYRHAFATRWLLAGRSIEILAELLGNTPETIRKHYGHLCGAPKALRQHFDDFQTSGQ